MGTEDAAVYCTGGAGRNRTKQTTDVDTCNLIVDLGSMLGVRSFGLSDGDVPFSQRCRTMRDLRFIGMQ